MKQVSVIVVNGNLGLSSIARTSLLSPKTLLGNLYICDSGIRLVRFEQRRGSYTRRLCYLRGRVEGKTIPGPVSPWSTEMWCQTRKLSVPFFFV